MDYREAYAHWCTDPVFDAQTKAELAAIREDDAEIRERFGRELEFGTGGLRGVMGAGTNRVNFYTIGKATQGLANYIQKEGAGKKGVVIAYDSRNNSQAFAERTGLVFAANGIKAYVFESLRPTPELSFALRALGCTAGVVITASHNPPAYNGYKVYWADGAQVTPPRDKAILEEVAAVVDYADIRLMEKEAAIAAGLYEVIGAAIDEKYEEAVKGQMLNPDVDGSSITVVYTPLHGTGLLPVTRVLRDTGFSNVHVVPEQAKPDGNFTTVDYPNPEDPKAFALALALAKQVDADIVVATDPDADRVGVVAKDATGAYAFLSGNMSGALLTEYVLSERKKQNNLPENAVVVKTIVTTNMIEPIAKAYGAGTMSVLTGFKYIGEKIKEFEAAGDHTYVFGFEESYGCLSGTYARDKDAVCATLLLCELAACYKAKGMTLFDGLEALYQKYGYYAESVRSLTLEGLAGMEKIRGIMTSLREKPPKAFAGTPVTWVRDYQSGRFVNLATGDTDASTLPVSNVLHYTLEDGGWICVRPSGTEPKLKFYFGVTAANRKDMEEKKKRVSDAIAEWMASF